jgi:hypothetical protein
MALPACYVNTAFFMRQDIVTRVEKSRGHTLPFDIYDAMTGLWEWRRAIVFFANVMCIT